MNNNTTKPSLPPNFIRNIIAEDLKANKNNGRIATRFPPEPGADFMDYLNPDSLQILTSCRVEPSLSGASPGSRYQFERLGYFCVDSVDSHEGALAFNRTATLRDSWAKIEKKQGR